MPDIPLYPMNPLLVQNFIRFLLLSKLFTLFFSCGCASDPGIVTWDRDAGDERDMERMRMRGINAAAGCAQKRK